MEHPSGSRRSSPREAAEPRAPLGGSDLPSWDLADLFPAAELEALRTALQDVQERARLFAAEYRGRLAELTPAGFAAARPTAG